MKTKKETLKAAKYCSKNVVCRDCTYNDNTANCLNELLTDLIKIIEGDKNEGDIVQSQKA